MSGAFSSRVAVLVKMVVDGLPPRVGRAPNLGRQRLDRKSLPDLREPLGLADRGFHVGERALEAAERRREEADALVEIHDLAFEAVGRAEVDDLDRRRPVDAVEAADALLHRGRIARQVEEDEPAAELEVAALAAGLGRDQKRRAVGPPELRHLDVSAFRGELLVKDRDALAGRGLQPRLEGRKRLAVVDEDERLGGPGRAPFLVPLREPRDARVGVVLPVAGQAGGGQALEVDRRGHPGLEPADVHAPRRARARRQRLAALECGEEFLLGRVGVGPEQLEQAEEAVRVRLERRRREQQHVARDAGERRDGAVRVAPGVAPRALEAVRLVHDEKLEPRRLRLRGEPGLRDEVLERDDRVPVRLEGVEALAVLLHDVLAPLAVEEDERLVELAVELAEPLDRERRGRDDERPVGPVRAQEAREDEAGLDRLAEAHFVGEQPADGIGRRGALGDVELVREERDAPAEERAQPGRLADLGEEEAVEPVPERGRAIRLQRGEALDGVVRRRERPEEQRVHGSPVGEAHAGRPDRGHQDLSLLALEPRLLAGAERQRAQRRVVGRERQARLGRREEDDDAPPVHLLDAPRPEVGVELVKELVVFAEGGHEAADGARGTAIRQADY